MSEATTTEASPENAPAAPTRKQTALMKRLARMKEHKDFPKAMEHTPPTEENLERASRKVRNALLLIVGGALIAIWGLTAGTGWFRVGLGAFMIVRGMLLAMRGLSERSSTLSSPLERRVALVADRRSETALGWVEGRTTYFFQLEFDDGSNGEFRYPGRGVSDDLLVKGNTGVAFLRGDTLIAWKNIKV